jgi:DMSO/TMAO reductase YedYZ heme-binding membrane subunit
VPRTSDNRNLPAGMQETLPLIVGVLAISIPVSLLVLAAVGGSVVVLVLAVLAMLGVGAATLTFVMLLAGDAHGQLEGGEAGAE